MLFVIGLTFRQLPLLSGFSPRGGGVIERCRFRRRGVSGGGIGMECFWRIGLTFRQLPLFVGLLPTRTWGYREVSPSATWVVGGSRQCAVFVAYRPLLHCCCRFFRGVSCRDGCFLFRGHRTAMSSVAAFSCCCHCPLGCGDYCSGAAPWSLTATPLSNPTSSWGRLSTQGKLTEGQPDEVR